MKFLNKEMKVEKRRKKIKKLKKQFMGTDGNEKFEGETTEKGSPIHDILFINSKIILKKQKSYEESTLKVKEIKTIIIIIKDIMQK